MLRNLSKISVFLKMSFKSVSAVLGESLSFLSKAEKSKSETNSAETSQQFFNFPELSH